MTHHTLENAITEEFARQAAAAPDGAGVRDRIRTHTVDRRRAPHARRPWLLPVLASAAVLAIAVPVTILASQPDNTSTHRTSSPLAAGTGAACIAQNLSIVISRTTAKLADAELARFTNTASTACTLSGYPTVVAKTANTPRKVAKQTLSGPLGGVRDHGTPPQVTLAPGDTATSMIESNDGDGFATDCETFDHLAVAYSPTSPATVTTTSMALCNLEVHPYVAGLTGVSPAGSPRLPRHYATSKRTPTAPGASEELLVHCGVKYANFYGRTWVITPPVPAWRRVPINGIITDNGHIQGIITLTDRNTLVFTVHDPGIAPDGQRFTFHPTQDRPPLCI